MLLDSPHDQTNYCMLKSF